jgi:hypothetical protein
MGVLMCVPLERGCHGSRDAQQFAAVGSPVCRAHREAGPRDLPTDSRAGNAMWLLSVGGRAYAGRNGDLRESC